MSKYIIEIKPEYEGTTKGIIVLGIKNNCLCVDELAIEKLEELNSDYINEHFSDLQDTAYQKGFEDGVTKRTDGDVCAGCEYKGKTGEHLPCEYCMNNFTNQRKPKDVQFEFGDEIIDSNGVKGCVISMNNEKSDTMYALFGGYRVPQCICQKNYRKTGKHYDVDDIKKLLEDMRHD